MASSQTKSVNLHELCEQGNHQALKAAATANNCNQLDNYGLTPLSHAANVPNEGKLQNQIKCAEILLNLGVDPNLPDQGLETPLFNAIYYNSGDMIRLLVSKGADVNYVSSEYYNSTPLMLASSCGKLAAVQLLIHLGARLDLKSSLGSSARDRAEEEGHNSVAMCLDEFAAATGTGNLGLTNLHIFCIKGKQQELKAAATRNNCNKQNNEGRTPLHYAACVNNETELTNKMSCAQTLLNLGADPNLPNQMGSTPLFSAVATQSGDMIRLLLSNGADVNYVSSKGFKLTPLLYASWHGKVRAVPVLLQMGATLDLKDCMGRSARDLAEFFNHTEIVQCLDKFVAASVRSSPTAALPTNTSLTQLSAAAAAAAAPVTSSPTAASHPNPSQTQLASDIHTDVFGVGNLPMSLNDEKLKQSGDVPKNTSLPKVEKNLPADAKKTPNANLLFNSRASQQRRSSVSSLPAINQNQSAPAMTPAYTDTKQYYPISKPLGICAIVNVNKYHRESKIEDRPGSEHDVALLKTTFEKLNFEVKTIESEEGLTTDKIYSSLAGISFLNHTRHSAFVCFLMAHGSEGVIYGANGLPMQLSDIQTLFSPSYCPSLANKPKMFFVQACRHSVRQYLQGSNIHQEFLLGSGNRASSLADDFFVAFATVANEPAYRHKKEGSLFVRVLCNVLSEKYESLHLDEIMAEVNSTVRSNPYEENGIIFPQAIQRNSLLAKLMSFNVDRRS